MFKIFCRAIIKNDNWELLLIKKLPNQKIAWWKVILPWGALEFWEELEDCLKREVLEEVWLEIVETKFLCFYKIILDDVHWLGAYFDCKTNDLSFENKEPSKHEKVFWWNVNDINDWIWDIISKYL